MPTFNVEFNGIYVTVEVDWSDSVYFLKQTAGAQLGVDPERVTVWTEDGRSLYENCRIEEENIYDGDTLHLR